MPAREKQHVHLIGIGGSGLSAIARLLLESGYRVTGSDRAHSPALSSLEAAGARVFTGHRAENIQGADLVVRSSAVPDDNPEVLAAQAAGIPVLKRSQFLGQLVEDRLTIAVAGTHGKTTTTAMVAWMLSQMGMDPSYIIGGTAKDLGGSNAHAGSGRTFVIEADEYDRMFLGLAPDVMVITYLEHDHPDCFPTPQDYFTAFTAFVQRLRPGGVLLVSADHPDTLRLAASAGADTLPLSFGTNPAADYTAVNLQPNAQGGFDYDAFWKDEDGQAIPVARVRLGVPGIHNVRNSLAALAVAHQILPHEGLAEGLETAAGALSHFSGTGRRFDILGEAGGVAVIDDYAHHPTAVRATLAAARARYPGRRIWAVWQPHTYSRTQSLMQEFAGAFTDADQVIVTEVYAAREKAADFGNFSAQQAAGAIAAWRSSSAGVAGADVHFLPTLEAAAAHLLDLLRPGDVLLVLSAGDADRISAGVLAQLRQREGAA